MHAKLRLGPVYKDRNCKVLSSHVQKTHTVLKELAVQTSIKPWGHHGTVSDGRTSGEVLSYQARMTRLWTEALSLAVQSECVRVCVWWGWRGSAHVCDKHIYACVGEGGSKMGLRKHHYKQS